MIKYLIGNKVVIWILLFALISSIFLTIYAYQLPLERREVKVLYEYTTRGIFDYSVKLNPNILYESDLLLNPNKVFLKPTDKVIINVIYVFNSTSSATFINNTLYLEVVLSHPQVWSKILNSSIAHTRNNVIKYTFELDVPTLINLARNISQSVDISSSKYVLSVNCVANTIFEVYNTTKTTSFPFSLQMSIDLIGKTIEFSNREFNNTYVSKTYDISEYTVRVGSFNLGTSTLRQVASILLTIISILTVIPIGINVTHYYKARRGTTTRSKISRKYKSLIIEASDISSIPSSMIVRVRGIEELAKISENIVKPIVHLKTGDKHVYYVFDEDVTFTYEREE
ncbi:MAG: DUF5305 family protein [Desulfurococcaceae archaeon]